MTVVVKDNKHQLTYDNDTWKIDGCEVKLDHTSWAMGYLSRKHTQDKIESYHGRFGDGYKVHTPAWNSTNYHAVSYYILVN